MAKQLVFILGSGGHAKMVIEAFLSMDLYKLFGCLDPSPTSDQILGLPIFPENEDTLGRLLEARAHAFVAIGDNRLRERVSGQVQLRGFELATAIAQSAYISPSALLGPGTVVMPKAVVGSMARIGRGVILNTSSSVDHDTIVGDYAHIAPGCHLAGSVQVDQGAMLGIGTCVIPQRRIGAWSILGANSTVVRDIPAETTYVGTPAREASVPWPRSIDS
jgi:UDP-perosamine 4-acetyltransferase